MQTTPTIEPTGSPVPGLIPEPLRVHHDTVAADEHPTGAAMPASPPGRRNPASSVRAKLLSAIRGDKHMVDAYPPAWHGAPAARPGVAAKPAAAPVASRTRER
jgi:hypothetical protein